MLLFRPNITSGRERFDSHVHGICYVARGFPTLRVHWETQSGVCSRGATYRARSEKSTFTATRWRKNRHLLLFWWLRYFIHRRARSVIFLATRRARRLHLLPRGVYNLLHLNISKLDYNWENNLNFRTTIVSYPDAQFGITESLFTCRAEALIPTIFKPIRPRKHLL